MATCSQAARAHWTRRKRRKRWKNTFMLRYGKATSRCTCTTCRSSRVDHNPELTGDQEFNPAKHNWLRADKVPMLVLNATTVNTGHAWQFTPTWMGESPWSTHPAADSVPRLQWHYYEPGSKTGKSNWPGGCRVGVRSGSCLNLCVSMTPTMVAIRYSWSTAVCMTIEGTVALLAHNCSILIVSDAAGQLLA